MPKQVASIYALNNDLLSNIPLDKITEWESGFYSFLDASKSDLLTAISAGWKEETIEALKNAISEFNDTFNA
jgi:F0F1-type ATP synthase alpha subunit